MNTPRRIVRNFASLALSEAFSKAIQLFLFAYLARSLGPAEFGVFNFSFAASMIFFVAADFGINTYLIREISRKRENASRLLGGALAVKILLSFGVLLIAGIFAMTQGEAMAWLILLMASFGILQSFTDSFFSAFRGFERMHYDSSLKVARMVLLGAAILAFPQNAISPAFTAASFVLVEFAILLCAGILYHCRIQKFAFQYDPRSARDLLIFSFPFFLSVCFSTISSYWGPIGLRIGGGMEDVGFYSAALNLIIGLSFIPLMYANTVYPLFSRYFLSDKDLLKFAYGKSYYYLLILGLPLTITLFFAAPSVIGIFYGVSYGSAITVFKILLAVLLIRFVNVLNGTLLSAMNLQTQRSLGQGIGCGILVALSFILIPYYGIIGMAWASIAGEVTVLCLYLFFSSKKGYFPSLSMIGKPALASVPLLATLLLMRGTISGQLIGCALYAASLALLRAFSKEDTDLARRILKS